MDRNDSSARSAMPRLPVESGSTAQPGDEAPDAKRRSIEMLEATRRRRGERSQRTSAPVVSSNVGVDGACEIGLSLERLLADLEQLHRALPAEPAEHRRATEALIARGRELLELARGGCRRQADLAETRRCLAETRRGAKVLEEEMQRLEGKALGAIAESGRLRRQIDELDQARETCRRDLPHQLVEEHAALRRRLDAEAEERSLLVRALSDSESEIARLARSIDILSRQFDAA